MWDRITLTCYWRSFTGDCPIQPPNTRFSRSWRCGTATRFTAYLRLMELDQASGDWAGVARNARRFLAVNPLVPTPHRQLARAAEHLGERDDALTAYRAVALLGRHRPGRSALPSGQAAARGGQAARGPPRSAPVIGGSAALSRGASALARAGRAQAPPPPATSPPSNSLPKVGIHDTTTPLCPCSSRCVGDRRRCVAGPAVSARRAADAPWDIPRCDTRGSRGSAQLERGRSISRKMSLRL